MDKDGDLAVTINEAHPKTIALSINPHLASAATEMEQDMAPQ